MQIPHQTYKIDLNNINEPLTRMIESVNDKGVRFVDVELWANSQKVTLPQNCTATAAFVTDGFLISESVDCSISDDLTTVIVPIDNANIESKSGIMLVEIKITDESGNILTPPFAFKVRVKKSITEDANIFEKSYGTVSEILKEVAEARGDSKTLKDEIATKADKTEIDTALATKADKETTYTKSEVDTKLSVKLDNTEGSVKRENIDVNAIGTEEIDSGAVDTVNIADGAVTEDKLSADVKNSISELKSDLSKLKYNVNLHDGYWNAGKIGVNPGCEYTDYIKTSLLESMSIPRENTLSGISYFDFNKTFIGHCGYGTDTLTDITIIPETAVYVIFSHFKKKSMSFTLKNMPDYFLSELDREESEIKKIASDVKENSNAINANTEAIDELKQNKITGDNLYNADCETKKGFVTNNGDDTTGYSINTNSLFLHVFIPVKGETNYTFVSNSVTKKGTYVFQNWTDENKTPISGKNIEKMVAKTKTINGIIYSLYELTSPTNAKYFVSTIKTKDTDARDENDFILFEGTADDFVSPYFVTNANGKLLYDKQIREELPQIISELMDDATHQCKDMNWVAFGDSITDSLTGGYAEIVKEKVKCNLINKGSSGADTKRLISIVTGSEVNRYTQTTFPEIDYSNVDIVTIMIGTNGALNDGSTFKDIPKIMNNGLKTISDGGTVTYNDQTITTVSEYVALFPNNYFGNLSLSIEWILWKNPNIKIYLLSPPVSAQLQIKVDNDALKLKEAMKQIGQYYGVEVVDVTSECGISVHNLSIYTRDNTHPNTLGHTKIADYLCRKIFCYVGK